ncbi:MAG: hypothetical protein WBV93_09335 [Anaerobacillus sp.]
MTTPQLDHEDLKLTELSYIKINALLLLAIIPLSIIGYFLAVSTEPMFFVYEWSLVVILTSSLLLSISTAVVYTSSLKWLSFSILAFVIQFSLFCLFIGPYTVYWMFFVYYTAAIGSSVVFVLTLRRGLPFRFMTIVFIIFTIGLTAYMVILNSLWGVNWI